VKFYRETEFQETDIGKIPKDWKVTKLGEITLEMYYGLTAKAVDYPTELKMLRTTDIKDYNVFWENLPYCEITDNRKFNIQKYLLRRDDIIISRAGTAGVSVLVEKDFENVIFGSYLIKVRLNTSLAFPKFIHYYFQSRYYWKQILPQQAGSTLKNISLPTLRRIVTPLPPFEEQKRITGILSTVDKTLEDVDKTISRLERLKKALMGELLSGRIRVKEIDGKFIFYRETEFQETDIGKIPKDWKTVKIDELFELYKGTTPSTKIKSYWDGNIPFVTPTDITSTKSIYLIVTEKYLSKEGLQSKKLKLVPENSLLFTSRATIGYLAINRQKVAINQGIIALIPRKSNISSLFYYYYLLYKRKMFEELAGGSTYKEISMSIFSKVVVPLLPFEEQKRIADILSTVDKSLELYINERGKLEKVKNGLMNILLAGKVRVRED
jgi:type I restriction enzyme S subunit